MNISKDKIIDILKTLPISYYAKRDVKCEFDEETDSSYYDIMNDKIMISYKQLVSAFTGIDENISLSEEEIVRTMLYHEVSHAILTPNKLNCELIFNIFEDERIETILANYYMNTNFKKMVKLVNHFKGEKPKNPMQMFYQVVRYRIGKAEYVEEVKNIISRFSNLNKLTANIDVYRYQEAIRELFEKIKNEFPIEQSTESPKSGNGEDGKNNSQNDTQSMDNNVDQNMNEQSGDNSKSEISENEKDDQFSAEDAEEMIKNVTTAYSNSALAAQVYAILKKATGETKRNASAINSYSGRFDVRSVGREDYKYFVQSNRVGHVKAFAKYHLNLFIDSSGSFYESEFIVNNLLYCLNKVEEENPNFTYTLITCSRGEKIIPKGERKIKCIGGNYLTENIFEIFKKVQEKGSINYNIVMFDGDATSCVSGPMKTKSKENFKAFNKSNVTIISDIENETPINRFCKLPKVIITKNYTNELISNVLKALVHFVK